MHKPIIGWDIGGAHVKAAVLNEWGEAVSILQKPCPLWQGLDTLGLAVNQVMREVPPENYRHAVTMTGDLVDLFEGRDEGVKTIIETMKGLLSAEPLIYAGRLGVLDAAKTDTSH